MSYFYLSLPAASVYFNYTEQAKCLNITNQGEKTCLCDSFISAIFYARKFFEMWTIEIKIIREWKPVSYLTSFCIKTWTFGTLLFWIFLQMTLGRTCGTIRHGFFLLEHTRRHINSQDSVFLNNGDKIVFIWCWMNLDPDEYIAILFWKKG